MTDSAITEHYRQRRAPAGALPRALQAYEVRRKTSVRPQFWAPVVAGALAFALWFGMYLPDDRQADDALLTVDRALPPLPVLARLRTPARPPMPSLTSLSRPAGSVTIPQFNQITLNPTTSEET